MGNSLSKNAGARMVLHDPEQEPLPDEDGIDLSPSSSSSISTTLVGRELFTIVVTSLILFKITDRSDQIAFPV